MTLPPPKICRRIRKLLAQMGSSDKDREIARAKLDQLLVEYKLTWNDLPAILVADVDGPGDAGNAGSNSAAPAAPTADEIPNLLELLLALIEEHVSISAEERLAIALWVLHCWVFDRFVITPRLALLSPVRGCGKTVTLSLIELLVPAGERVDHTTAAVIYHKLDRQRGTVLLVDEADGLGLHHNGVLRSVFNSGHRKGGAVERFISGRPQRYRTHAPLTIAAIGMLPLPLMHRSVVINMQRASAPLKRLNENDPAIHLAREGIRSWARGADLASDPEMPPALKNRTADNWRVLLAIADALGCGEAARTAAVALSAGRPDEDPGVMLLADIRAVFATRGVDRIHSGALIEALLALDSGWDAWRGPNDDQAARRLSRSELARMLKPFGIRSRTIWPARRRPGDKSAKGYLRADFEKAWRDYCFDEDGTTAHPSKIIHLPR